MADRRGVIVPLLVLAFIFLSPDPARPAQRQPYTGFTFDDVIEEEKWQLAQLQNSTYSYDELANVNITGLEDDRGFAWDALREVRNRARSQVEYARGDLRDWATLLGHTDGSRRDDVPPLYRNVTGFIHGDWVRSPVEGGLAPTRVNLTHYATFGPFGPVVPDRFGRNLTAAEGEVRLRLRERPFATFDDETLLSSNVTSLTAELTLNDDSGEHNVRLRGVYFLDAGQAMLTTTSEKFAGIFALPFMALSKEMFDASRVLLNGSISETIQQQADGRIDSLNPWSSSIEGAPDAPVAVPSCELVVYLHQHVPGSRGRTGIESSVINLLEQELRYPTGAYVPPAPEMTFSMLAFSPDCGYILESKGPPDYAPKGDVHLTGPKAEVLSASSRKHVLFFAIVLIAQLLLLKRQMHEASTPSTQSRISLYTVAMLALGDGFVFMTFLLVSFFIGGLWITVMSAAFVSFVGVSFFGMRFLMDIWMVQAPERLTQRREAAEEERRREEQLMASLRRLREARDAAVAQQQQSAAAPPRDGEIAADAVTNNASEVMPPSGNNPSPTSTAHLATAPTAMPSQTPAELLPLPVTAPRPTDTGATPVFMPSDQQGLESISPITTTAGQPLVLPRESFGSLYTRFYLLLLFILFLTLNATSWPSGIRRVYFAFLGFLYLSFWLPQINRNVQRNCRKALSWEFVVGQSLTRYAPFIYFYSYPTNVVFIDDDYISLGILGIWIWLQILVLVSQEIIGPRWFVRQDWAPPAYDYHPVLREDEEGATLPIGFSQATQEAEAAKPSSDFPVAGRERIEHAPEKGKRVFDCAICMQELEVPIIESGASGDKLTGPAGLLARRMYMVTPCRHIFHSACLEGWMKYRLQCPICRETLPPL